MKKQLLMLCSLALSMQVNAIDRNGVRKETKYHAASQRVDQNGTSFTSYNLIPNAVPNQFVAAPSATASRVEAGSSPNLYTAIFGMMNAVYANQDLNLVSYVRRKNAGDPGNSGYVQASITTNLGQTMDSTLALVSDDVHLCRYPSGAIFNPPGNTDVNNAFILASAPWHPGANWQGNAFASVKVNGTNNRVWIQDNLDPVNTQAMDLVRNDFQATDNAVYVAGSEYTDVNGTTAAAQGWIKGVLVKGAYSAAGDSFVWSTRGFPHNFQLDPIDTSKKVFTTTHTAWSQDGQTGYFVYNGVDANITYNSYQPIVYKTTDGGANWNLMPIFNFGTVTPITQMLRATSSGTKRPFFGMTHGYDVTVDKNDQLHIACVVSSASSEDLDSLDYTWNFPLNVFDVYTTDCGWSANFIDTLRTADVADANSPWTDQGGIGWGARINIGRTQDGSKIFVTWLDSDPAVWGAITENTFPDVKGRGYDVDLDKLTPIVNFTSDDIINNGKNYWYFSSAIDLKKNDTTFVVPSSIADSRLAGDPGTGPIQHKYLKGMEFTQSQFTQAPNGCPALNATITVGTCSTPTTVTTTATGACFAWDGVIGTSSQTFTSAGNHQVTVSANGCATTLDFVIPSPFGNVNTTTTAATGCTTNNASATASVSGTGTFSYTWNTTPAQTTATATGLAAGTTYEVTVSDNTGCSLTTEVTTPPAPAFSGTVTSSSTSPTGCTTTDGTASVNATGGTFTYQWNTTPIQTTSTATGVAVGQYTCIVADAGGCTQSVSVSVVAPANVSPSVSSFTTVNPTCNGGTNGSATANVTGGTPPYTYSWSNNLGTAATANNVAAGSYIVTVTDNGGCVINDTVTVTQPTAVTMSSNTIVAQTTPGTPDGSITVLAAGGTGPYTYQLGSGTAQAGNTFTNLTAGTYTITIFDANQCSGSTGTLIVPNYTGIRDMAADKMVQVSPNPTSGIVTIKLDNMISGGQVKMLTVTGQEIFATRITGSVITYDMSNLSKGVYFIQVINNDRVISKRVIRN